MRLMRSLLLAGAACALAVTGAEAAVSTITIQPLGQAFAATINCDAVSWYQVEYVIPLPPDPTVDIHFGNAVIKAAETQGPAGDLISQLQNCQSAAPRRP